jgi:hypothetical protein
MYDITPPVLRTPLGNVNCRILINGSEIGSNLLINDFSIEPNGQILRWQTNHHLIKVIYFNPLIDLPSGMSVKDSGCWLFRISKLSDQRENISLLCELSHTGKNIDGGPESEQGLIALTFHDGLNMLSIGSESGNYLANRASINDWFPGRFCPEIAETAIYSINKNSLKINVPDLKYQEKIQFQFISAWSEYDREKTDTICAVNQDYHKLLGSISF